MSHWEITLPTSSELVMKFKTDPTATTPELKWVGSASTASTPPATTTTPTAWAADVEKMLQRFEQNSRTKKWPHRQIAEHLKGLGFEPATPATGSKPYIHWYVHGTHRPITLYQEASGIVIDSNPLLSFALTLPGATDPKGKHPKVKWAYGASVDEALDAATKFRKHADK